MKGNNGFYKPKYVVIQDWMTIHAGLKGSELMIYALIYGFSQDGETKYTGSTRYIKNMLNIGRTSARSALLKLEEKGFIIKTQSEVNNIIFNAYEVTEKCIPNVNFGGGSDSDRGGRIPTGGGSDSDKGGGSDSDPNNTSTNNKENKKEKGDKPLSAPKLDSGISDSIFIGKSIVKKRNLTRGELMKMSDEGFRNRFPLLNVYLEKEKKYPKKRKDLITAISTQIQFIDTAISFDPKFRTIKFVGLLIEWLEYKHKVKGKPYKTSRGVLGSWKKIIGLRMDGSRVPNWSIKDAQELIENALEGEWAGLYHSNKSRSSASQKSSASEEGVKVISNVNQINKD